MIRELHVTCVADEAVAPDVGLRLRRGESTWLPADALQQSLVLRGLVEVRAVIVNLEKRYANLRPTPSTKPPRARPPTPSASPVAYISPAKPPTPPSAPSPPAGFRPVAEKVAPSPSSEEPMPKKRGRPPKVKSDTDPEG